MCYLTLNFKYRCLKLFQLTTAFLPLWSSRYQSPSSTTVLFFYAVPPSLPSPLLPFDHRPPALVEIPFSSQPSAAVGIKDGRFNFHRDNAEHCAQKWHLLTSLLTSCWFCGFWSHSSTIFEWDNISVSFLFRPMNFLGGLSNRWTIAATFGATGSTVMTMALGGGNSISFVPSESPWVGSK